MRLKPIGLYLRAYRDEKDRCGCRQITPLFKTSRNITDIKELTPGQLNKMTALEQCSFMDYLGEVGVKVGNKNKRLMLNSGIESVFNGVHEMLDDMKTGSADSAYINSSGIDFQKLLDLHSLLLKVIEVNNKKGYFKRSKLSKTFEDDYYSDD